jgi:trigger factor
MNITKHDIDKLNAEIKISVTPIDYEQRVSEGIKKVQRQANMPGFRPGKVPSGLIKKQYGTQILVDEINKLLNDTIYKYIEENNIDILGNPLPKDQHAVDFNTQKDFEFVYELGLAPEFKIELGPNDSFDYKVVKVDDSLVEKYVNDVRRNYGKPTYPELAGEKDIIFVDINELDANGDITPGGIYKSTSISYERTNNEKAKAKLLGAKKDDKIVININDLYENAVDKSVSLGIEKEQAEHIDCNLQLTVKNISRLEEASLDQELFDKVYGEGNINSEEEFKEKIRAELGQMFNTDSEKFLRTEVEKKLIEKIDLQLPDAFLKRWLSVANEKPISNDEIEKEYPSYAKAMQWKLIENKIIKENEIKVDISEAKEEAKTFIKSEYARYGQVATEQDLDKISSDLLSKEKEAQKIFENVYSRKVLALIKEKATLQIREVSYDEFFKN